MANSIFLSNGLSSDASGNSSTTGSITAGSQTTGSFYAADGTAALPSYSWTSDPDTGLVHQTPNTFSGSFSGAIREYHSATLFALGSGTLFAWSSGTDPFATSGDMVLSRSAAGVLAVGTTAANNLGTVDATLYKQAGTSGVVSFGPAAVASITVRGGIITAIS